MHKPCITVGQYACDPGSDLFNLLLSKKVDLILSGHEHTYQRSHQLGLGAGCTTLVPGRFNAACVVDSDSTFTQGAGSVVDGGRHRRPGLVQRERRRPRGRLLRRDSRGSTRTRPSGCSTSTPPTTRCRRRSSEPRAARFTDSFTITARHHAQRRRRSPPSPPSCTNLTCYVRRLGHRPTPTARSPAYAWDFGDGSHRHRRHRRRTPTRQAGSYSVSLTVTDNDGAHRLGRPRT